VPLAMNVGGKTEKLAAAPAAAAPAPDAMKSAAPKADAMKSEAPKADAMKSEAPAKK